MLKGFGAERIKIRLFQLLWLLAFACFYYCFVIILPQCFLDGAPIRKNFSEKPLYFSSGSTDVSQTFGLCMYSHNASYKFH